MLRASIEALERNKRRRIREAAAHLRRGVMRHFFVILDCGAAASDTDLRPTRLECAVRLMASFLRDWFEQNPISQLGLIVTWDGRAERVAELGGSPARLVELLRAATSPASQTVRTGGEPSLVNALELARQALRHTPMYTSREVLVIMSSLTTRDPSNIDDTIATLCEDRIRCSVIGLAAEMYVCRMLATQTGGRSAVALDERHFQALLAEHTTPPAASSASFDAILVRMGFPRQSTSDTPVPCACHGTLQRVGYTCPQCGMRYCELPFICVVCQLTLVSTPHLARGYRHLFALPVYRDVDPESVGGHCYACLEPLHGGERAAVQCTRCQYVLCLHCEAYTLDTLHQCPGCGVGAASGQAAAAAATPAATPT